MKHFKNILVYLHDSQQIDHDLIRRAVKLAIRNKAEVTLLTGMKSIPKTLNELIQSKLKSKLLDDYKKQIDLLLEQALEPHKEQGIPISYRFIEGKPFLSIIKQVLKNAFDLVILSPDKEDSVRDMFFGTTVMNLLRKCPRPVWVFKPALKGTYNRVLAAVDTSTRIDEEKRLNASIVEMARVLAEREDAELHFVHCWEASGEIFLRSSIPPAYSGIIEEYKNKIFTTAQKDFEECIGAGGADINKKMIHFNRGAPGVVIPELVRQLDVELVVMGTLGRSGITGLFIGNSAEKIIDGIDCSVLALKPDGFVSPVK